MRLTKKKIDDVVVRILGEEGLSLVSQLKEKENISEFDLAKKIKKDIKIVRKMLYVLYNYNLVGFHRKKDKEKGWYIYYWKLLSENIKFEHKKWKKELLSRLQERLEAECKELFFVCPSRCTRLTFDQALELEFHCPECGSLLGQDENEPKIREIRRKIGEIQEELRSEMEEEKKEGRGRMERKAEKKKAKSTKPAKKKIPKGKKKIKKALARTQKGASRK